MFYNFLGILISSLVRHPGTPETSSKADVEKVFLEIHINFFLCGSDFKRISRTVFTILVDISWIFSITETCFQVQKWKKILSYLNKIAITGIS